MKENGSETKSMVWVSPFLLMVVTIEVVLRKISSMDWAFINGHRGMSTKVILKKERWMAKVYSSTKMAQFLMEHSNEIFSKW